MANLIPATLDLEDYCYLGQQESQWLRPASDFRDAIAQRRDGSGNLQGQPLPWEVPWFSLRPGEVTMWCGFNHHGKSRISGMVAAWLMRECRQVIASFEMPASATLHRMCAQCAGRLDYSDQWLDEWIDHTDDYLWLYDVQERTAAERVLGLVYYAALELQAAHVWIDSLMQVGLSGETRDAYQRQALWIDDVCRAAKVLGVHVHIVHHLRKPSGDHRAEERVPSRYEARGAGELVDRCDNVIIIHRNVRKQRLREEGESPDDLDEWRDGTLFVDKQRHALGEQSTGRVRMWDHASGQWLARNTTRAMPWKSKIVSIGGGDYA